ncbi:MAG: alcohol dehydrogenase catalytic domain-containing protein [Candidatus Thorarchaeota archaeon]|nr:MAG: alcohol dehydrogenase catalytic domain-containing protein [Candidatus Thorarchaeota archaeon]
MRAAVYGGAQDIQVKEIPEPILGPRDVLVRPKYVGICGTDLSAWEYGMYEGGLVLGHEFTGEIVDVGNEVTEWRVGDRVVPNSLIPCGVCSYCTSHRHSLCEDMQMVGISMNGGLADLVGLPETTLHTLPETVDFKAGVFVEPLAVAIRGFHRVDFGEGMDVLVLGTGPIGLLSIQYAKIKGASKVYASEIQEARLQAARNVGADMVINPQNESLSLRLENYTAAAGVDLVVECTGKPQPTAESFSVVKRGGSILILGISEEPVEVDFMTGVLNELTVHFSYLGYAEFPEAIELLADKQIQTEQLITRVIPLERVVEDGFEALTRPDSSDVKVLVEI